MEDVLDVYQRPDDPARPAAFHVEHGIDLLSREDRRLDLLELLSLVVHEETLCHRGIVLSG